MMNRQSGSSPIASYSSRRAKRRCTHMPSLRGSPFHMQRGPYPERTVSGELELLARLQAQARHPSRQFLECDDEFDLGKLLTNTGMDSVPKREVLAGILAMDVELLWIGEHRLVAVSRSEQQQDVGTLRHRHAPDRSILQGLAAPSDDRRRVAQNFIHRSGDQRRVGEDR